MSEELQAKITLDAKQFSVGVGDIVAKLSTLEAAIASVGGKLENSLDKSLGQVNAKLQGLSLDAVGGKLSAAADQMQAALGAVVQPAIEFETAMRRVNTVAKLSDDELSVLSDQMRTLGQTIGISISPTEAAAAQYDILSAGFTNTADATEILTQAAIASRGGMTSSAAAADLLTSALNSYGVGADQAKHFNDVLFTGVEKGKLTFDDFVQGLGSVAPAAAANGVSIEELSSAMAALTAAGQQPARAFTGLNAAIVQLSSPTDEAKKAAAGLGINLEGAAFKGLSLVEKLQLLATTAGDNKAALRKVLGDVNALGVAYSLTGNGAKTYADALAASTGPSNAAANAAKQTSQGVEDARKRFEAAAQALGIALSTAILPFLAGLADAGTSALKFFDSFSSGAKGAFGVVLGLTTALTAAGAGIVSFLLGVRGVAFALGVQLPAASAAGGTALTTLSARVAAARTAMMGLNAAAIAGPALLLGLGAGIIALAEAYAQAETAALDAAKALDDPRFGQGLAGTKSDFSTGQLLNTPVADLKKAGADKADVQNRIRELRETLEQTVDQAARKTLEDKIKQLIEVREQLDKTGKETSAAASDRVRDFKLDPVVDQAAQKKATEERNKQALFEIETSKLSGQERIAALEALIAREKLVGDERRQIEQKIFQIREKLESNTAAAQKKAADDRKADELQAIDLSKASHQTKIQQLAALLVKYKEDGDTRRKIEQEIAREQDAIAKDQDEKRKKREEAQKKAADDARERTQEERSAQQDAIGLRKDAISTEIDTAKEKGGKGSTATILGLLAERQKLTEETIRLQLAEQLAQTQSAEAKVQLEKNAEERIRQERQKTADEAKKLTDAQIADTKRLEDSKKPKQVSTEFTGGLLTPEELSKQMAERFGGGAGIADFAARQQTTTESRQQQIAAGIAANIAEAQRKGIDLSKALGNPSTSLSAVTAGLPGKVNNFTQAPPVQKFQLEHTINIKLTREDGSTSTQRVTVSGVPGPGEGGSSSVNFGNRGRA